MDSITEIAAAMEAERLAAQASAQHSAQVATSDLAQRVKQAKNFIREFLEVMRSEHIVAAPLYTTDWGNPLYRATLSRGSITRVKLTQYEGWVVRDGAAENYHENPLSRLVVLTTGIVVRSGLQRNVHPHTHRNRRLTHLTDAQVFLTLADEVAANPRAHDVIASNPPGALTFANAIINCRLKGAVWG